MIVSKICAARAIIVPYFNIFGAVRKKLVFFVYFQRVNGRKEPYESAILRQNYQTNQSFF